MEREEEEEERDVVLESLSSNLTKNNDRDNLSFLSPSASISPNDVTIPSAPEGAATQCLAEAASPPPIPVAVRSSSERVIRGSKPPTIAAGVTSCFSLWRLVSEMQCFNPVSPKSDGDDIKGLMSSVAWNVLLRNIRGLFSGEGFMMEHSTMLLIVVEGADIFQGG